VKKKYRAVRITRQTTIKGQPSDREEKERAVANIRKTRALSLLTQKKRRAHAILEDSFVFITSSYSLRSSSSLSYPG
jgi:hypothetical protein